MPPFKRVRQQEPAFRPEEVTPSQTEQQRDVMSARVVKVVTDEQEMARSTMMGALSYFEDLARKMPEGGARRERA